ncbi:MAG: hypothetical protein JNG85_02900 [Spirochaetaceae bacterium]|nr:hypothetical protein [Spirochaetaceae bacterium]
MKIKHLDGAACRAAIAAGDFSADVAGAAPRVAIILTQSWCPQWAWMRSYLEALPDDPETAVYWVEYDLEPFFEEFMAFKEGVFGNDQVPYVRYYRGGRPSRESNFIDKAGFLRLLSA